MRVFETIQAFFEDWRFPVIMLSLLATFVLLMVSILLMPAATGTAGAFADAFRVWCFNYDPSTGELEWGYIWMYVVQPFVLAGGIYLLWRRPLHHAAQGGFRRIWPYAGSAVVVIVSLAAALFSLSGWESRADLQTEFAGARIRTSLAAPPFALVNQDGETVTLASLEGRVILVTAVYATCSFSCPLILERARFAIASLSPGEREGITVAVFTLDPEHDDSEVLQGLALSHELSAPQFNLLTGNRADMEKVLDQYQFARSRDPETGLIDHANQFVVIDRAGRIAYRLALGGLQDAWLPEALYQLAHEGAEG